MSLKYEQYRSLHRTHQFMRDILTMRVTDFRKMGKDGFAKWRDDAYYCIKHYPFLDKTGKPMFSGDEFECPVIEERDV